MSVLNISNLNNFLGFNYFAVLDENGLPSKVKISVSDKLYDLTTQWDRNILIRSMISDLSSMGLDKITAAMISEMYTKKLYDEYKKAILSL